MSSTRLKHTDHHPPALPDYLGAGDWAAFHGIGTFDALLLAAAFLGNTAGEAFEMADESGGIDAAGLNLVFPSEHAGLRSAVRELLSLVSRTHDKLVAHAGRHSAKEVEAVWHDPKTVASTEKGRRLKAAVMAPAGGPSGVPQFDPMEGVNPDRFMIEREAWTRPRFLLPDVFDKHLPASLAGCHQGFGFAVSGAAGLSLRPSEQRRQITMLLRLIDGASGPEVRKIESAVSGTSAVRLRMILALPGRDIRRMGADYPEFAERVLPLVSSAGGGETPDHDPNPDYVNCFRGHVKIALEQAISHRRSMHRLISGFSIPQVRMEYAKRRRDFITSTSADDRLIVGVEKLPAAMCWALFQLMTYARHGLDLRGVESWCLNLGFEVADWTRDRASHTFQQSRDEDLLRQKLALAEKILRILKENAPARFRAIARRLDVQSKEVNEPILTALVKAGVLIENHDHSFDLGKVPFSKVRSSIFLQSPE